MGNRKYSRLAKDVRALISHKVSASRQVVVTEIVPLVLDMIVAYLRKAGDKKAPDLVEASKLLMSMGIPMEQLKEKLIGLLFSDTS